MRSRSPVNCAVVTLPSGAQATFAGCDADVYALGELTITDRQTFAERIYQPGSWDAVAVYDQHGHYLYVIDNKPRPIVLVDHVAKDTHVC